MNELFGHENSILLNRIKQLEFSDSIKSKKLESLAFEVKILETQNKELVETNEDLMKKFSELRKEFSQCQRSYREQIDFLEKMIEESRKCSNEQEKKSENNASKDLDAAKFVNITNNNNNNNPHPHSTESYCEQGLKPFKVHFQNSESSENTSNSIENSYGDCILTDNLEKSPEKLRNHSSNSIHANNKILQILVDKEPNAVSSKITDNHTNNSLDSITLTTSRIQSQNTVRNALENSTSSLEKSSIKNTTGDCVVIDEIGKNASNSNQPIIDIEQTADSSYSHAKMILQKDLHLDKIKNLSTKDISSTNNSTSRNISMLKILSNTPNSADSIDKTANSTMNSQNTVTSPWEQSIILNSSDLPDSLIGDLETNLNKKRPNVSSNLSDTNNTMEEESDQELSSDFRQIKKLKTNSARKKMSIKLENNPTNDGKYKPDLVTIRVLFKLYEVHFKQNPTTKFTIEANTLRTKFNKNCLIGNSNNNFESISDLVKQTFKYLNEYRKKDCVPNRKNSVVTVFDSLEEIKQMIKKLKNEFNIEISKKSDLVVFDEIMSS